MTIVLDRLYIGGEILNEELLMVNEIFEPISNDNNNDLNSLQLLQQLTQTVQCDQDNLPNQSLRSNLAPRPETINQSTTIPSTILKSVAEMRNKRRLFEEFQQECNDMPATKVQKIQIENSKTQPSNSKPDALKNISNTCQPTKAKKTYDWDEKDLEMSD